MKAFKGQSTCHIFSTGLHSFAQHVTRKINRLEMWETFFCLYVHKNSKQKVFGVLKTSSVCQTAHQRHLCLRHHRRETRGCDWTRRQWGQTCQKNVCRWNFQSLPFFTSNWDQNCSVLSDSTLLLVWSISFWNLASFPSWQVSVNKMKQVFNTLGKCSFIFWKNKAGLSSSAPSELSWIHPPFGRTSSSSSCCQMVRLQQGMNPIKSAEANLSKPNRPSYSRRRAISADRGGETLFDRMHWRWSEGKQRAESSAIPDNRQKRSLFTMATGANKAMFFPHHVCRLPDDVQ